MTIKEIEKKYKVIAGCKENSRGATGYILKRKNYDYPANSLFITYTLGKSGIMTEPIFCGYDND